MAAPRSLGAPAYRRFGCAYLDYLLEIELQVTVSKWETPAFHPWL
jgi:hypothetical protein